MARNVRFELMAVKPFNVGIGAAGSDMNAGRNKINANLSQFLKYGCPSIAILICITLGVVSNVEDPSSSMDAGRCAILYTIVLATYTFIDGATVTLVEKKINNIYYDKAHLREDTGALARIVLFLPIAATVLLFLVVLPAIDTPTAGAYSFTTAAFRGALVGFFGYSSIAIATWATFKEQVYPPALGGMICLSGTLFCIITSVAALGFASLMWQAA